MNETEFESGFETEKRTTYVVQFNFVLIVLFVMAWQLIKDGAASSSAVISWRCLRIETAVCIWNNNCTIAVHYTSPFVQRSSCTVSYAIRVFRETTRILMFNDLHVSNNVVSDISFFPFFYPRRLSFFFFFFLLPEKIAYIVKITSDSSEVSIYMYVYVALLGQFCN